MPNGDRFLVLSAGHRYDLKPGSAEFRMVNFGHYGLRLESKSTADPAAEARAAAERSSKARSTIQLMEDNTDGTWSQVMWRISMPLAALVMAVMAIPLGAVNPRLGRSGDLLISGLVALLYMNLINLFRAWIGDGRIPFGLGWWPIHAAVLGFAIFLFMRRLRVKAPKDRGGKAPPAPPASASA
jgi:lipopolysaccharide export system permease protein